MRRVGEIIPEHTRGAMAGVRCCDVLCVAHQISLVLEHVVLPLKVCSPPISFTSHS